MAIVEGLGLWSESEERANRELKRAIKILRQASAYAYFARTELDSRRK